MQELTKVFTEYIIAGTALISLVVSVGSTLFNGGFGLSKKLGDVEETLSRKILESSSKLQERQDAATIQVGDSLNGIRQQIALNERAGFARIHELSDQLRQMEIWARDEFVRKDSFRDVCSRIEATVAEQSRAINLAIENMREAIMAIARHEPQR